MGPCRCGQGLKGWVVFLFGILKVEVEDYFFLEFWVKNGF